MHSICMGRGTDQLQSEKVFRRGATTPGSGAPARRHWWWKARLFPLRFVAGAQVVLHWICTGCGTDQLQIQKVFRRGATTPGARPPDRRRWWWKARLFPLRFVAGAQDVLHWICTGRGTDQLQIQKVFRRGATTPGVARRADGAGGRSPSCQRSMGGRWAVDVPVGVDGNDLHGRRVAEGDSWRQWGRVRVGKCGWGCAEVHWVTIID